MNVILIISDTFRYDNLFDRAAMPVNTPCLDAFSERAISIERMYTGSFPTVPHRTDLTSGRIGWPWYGWQSRLLGPKNHMPQILGKVGYVSQMLADCPHVFGCDIAKGFNGAYQVRGQEGDTYFLRMNHPIEHIMPPDKTRTGAGFQGHNLPDITTWANLDWRAESEEDRIPPRTAGLAVNWLEENYRYDPFLLWVDFFDPHEPWNPPEYMVRKYDPKYSGTPMIHPNYGKASDYSKAELRNLRAHYCAEAELVDRWVGRVLQKIDDLDLWKNSIVIFTSDHGISLGEHKRTGKSNINKFDTRCWPTYPEIAHVPFMIAAPGLEAGRKVDELALAADILPTVIDLAGLKVKPPEPFHGVSLAPLLLGRPCESIRDFAITGSCLRGRKVNGAFREAVTPVVYTKKWAYVPVGPTTKPELFDLTKDPYAERNVIGKHRRIAKRHHAMLVNWLREMDAPEDTLALFE